jgi:branched-chain amino acid transport system substrate-binding protein
MMRSARTATVAAGLALGLVLTACGDDANDNASESPGASDAPELTGDPIKLFSIQQITVTNQDATDEAADAVNAAVKRINDEGGINGRPVEVEVCDDKFSAPEGASCARQAVESGAVAVVGSTTQQGDAIYPVLEAAGVCNIAPQPINRLDYSSPVSYPVISGGPVNVAGYAYALKAVGATKIGVAYIDVPTAAGVVPFIDMGAKNAGGLTVGKKVPVPITTTDISAVVSSTIEGNDGAALILAPAQLSTFMRNLAEQGSDVFAAASAADDTIIEQIGPDAADNLVIAAGYLPISGDSEGMTQFREDMEEENSDAELNSFSVNGWLGPQVLKSVVEDAGLETIDAKGVCDALSKASSVDLKGVAPTVDFTKEFPIPGLNRIFNPFINVQKIEDGEVVQVNDTFLNPLDPSATAPAL